MYKSLVFGDEFLAHVRIEKGSVQPVAIKLETHNSLECKICTHGNY